MTEATLQAQLVTALRPLVAVGSVLVNDYHTPQVTSQDRSPWLIIETADEVEMSTGASGTTPSVTYKIGVTLLVYRRGQSNEAHLNAFQALRQAALATLALTPKVRGAAALTTITPWFPDENAHDPDSLMQRLGVDMTEYEV
jgi:hypothetical protein